MTQAAIRCDTCAVRHRSVCGALSQSEIGRLNAIAHHKTVPPGFVIFSDNEKPGYFANIITGVVKLTKSLGDGRQQIVGLQFPSDFLGRPYRPDTPYYAEAVTDVHLCTYERSKFEHLVKECPGFEHRLFENTLDELDAAREWMVLLGRKKAEERVASLLLMITRRMMSVGYKTAHAETHPDPHAAATFDLPLSRAEIADFLGLTIETVSRQFTRLKVAGLIGLEGARTIVVPDLARLQEAAEQSLE